MAKKREPKVIRVRYQAGDPSKTHTILEEEGYYLEAWVPTGENTPYAWSTICFAACRKSVDFPDAPDKDFIHYGILQRISEWVRMGYEFYYGTRETSDLDERQEREWAEYNKKHGKE